MHFAGQQLVHGAGLGHLQQALALFVVQVALQGDLAFDQIAAGRRAFGVQAQLHIHLLQLPLLARRIHLQRDRGAGAQGRQQQLQGVGRRVAAALVRGLVHMPVVALGVAKRDAIGGVRAGGVGAVDHGRSFVLGCRKRGGGANGRLYACFASAAWGRCFMRSGILR